MVGVNARAGRSAATVLATGLIVVGCSLFSPQDTSRSAYRTGDATVVRSEGMPDGPPHGDYLLVDGSYGEDPVARERTAAAVFGSPDGWMIYLGRFTGDGRSGDVVLASPRSTLEGGWTAIGSVGRGCEVEIADDLETEFAGTLQCTNLPVTIRSGEKAEVSVVIVFRATS